MAMELLYEIGTITAALLIVIDPLAIIPVLVGLSSHISAREYKGIVIKVVAGATILLLFFTITGTWILNLFDVTIDDLRIGGGLLLLILSIKLVTEGKISNLTDDSNRDAEYKAAIIPVISPLLIGPGAITAAVVLAAIHGVLITSIASVTAMIICWIIFALTKFLNKLFGASGTDLISRIMGVLIAAIAVSYIRSGILGIID